MNHKTACCGLKCSECPTFIATRNNDDAAREKVAALWNKQFKLNLTVSDMNCDGCHTDTGRLFMHCSHCEIRNCTQEKGIDNCAFCEDYACDKLKGFFAFMPHAERSLEKIRKDL